MADTARTLAALQVLLADNETGDISEGDVRDLLVSLFRQTTKGDLLGIADTGILGRLPATTDGYVLALDSTQEFGFKWVAVDSIADADGDTAWEAEQNPDEDILRGKTAGTERVTIDGTDVLVKTVPIQVVSIGEPATPSAGAIRLFSYVSAGRVKLASKGPDGVVCDICDFANVAAPHTNTLALNWVE